MRIGSAASILRAFCLLLTVGTVTANSLVVAHADYTRVNFLNRATLRDVDVNCDFRLRLVAGGRANNSYKITHVSQNANVGYILEAPLTATEAAELLAKGSGVINGDNPPTAAPGSSYAIRVMVPLNGSTVGAALVGGSSNAYLNTSVIDLERQCAQTTGLVAQGGGGDGCGMLGFKDPSTSGPLAGQCVCPYGALSTNNPCTKLSTVQFIGGPNGQRKVIGPVDGGLSNYYFFNAGSCSCDFCNPEIANLSPDRASCQCKFSNFNQATAAFSQNRNSPVLRAISDACMALTQPSGPSVPGAAPAYERLYFDQKSCGCNLCPAGKKANEARSGCI